MTNTSPLTSNDSIARTSSPNRTTTFAEAWDRADVEDDDPTGDVDRPAGWRDPDAEIPGWVMRAPDGRFDLDEHSTTDDFQSARVWNTKNAARESGWLLPAVMKSVPVKVYTFLGDRATEIA